MTTKLSDYDYVILRNFTYELFIIIDSDILHKVIDVMTYCLLLIETYCIRLLYYDLLVINY